MTKCYVEGKEYFKGEIMLSECHNCICAEGFDNSTISNNNHDCEKHQCNIEVYHSDQLNNGCIPIFHEKSNCCPFGYRCRK